MQTVGHSLPQPSRERTNSRSPSQPGEFGSDFLFLRHTKCVIALGQCNDQFLPRHIRAGPRLVEQAVKTVAVLVLVVASAVLPIKPSLKDPLQFSVAGHQTTP